MTNKKYDKIISEYGYLIDKADTIVACSSSEKDFKEIVKKISQAYPDKFTKEFPTYANTIRVIHNDCFDWQKCTDELFAGDFYTCKNTVEKEAFSSKNPDEPFAYYQVPEKYRKYIFYNEDSEVLSYPIKISNLFNDKNVVVLSQFHHSIEAHSDINGFGMYVPKSLTFIIINP